ncbi:MAG: response regulator [Opitutaceae bacterium]|nr:response regulator [Opitutaceae bacterium]
MSVPITTSNPPASAKHFLRILYADDVVELRDVARICLSRDGHGIECVPDGELAYNRIAADPGFDLVITDHHMPLLNGLELVKQLRELGYSGRIIVVSSELSTDVHAEYERLNVDRILYKPIYPSALRQVLRELFPGVARPAVTVTQRSDQPLRQM